MAVMPDYSEGIKKDVVEIKFLIHDLRVERFINEVIHFHVTLNTDLELCGVDQAQVLHGHDLQVLKEKAVSLRKAFQDYSNAVRNFSPDRTVLLAGRHYVNTIHSVCDLVLSPLWGRVDKVLTFLPPDSRSTKARTQYLNCIHFIRGVYYRIQQFLDEQNNKGVHQEFDIAAEIEDFMRDVVYGYVMEHSSGRVQIELDRLDAAAVGGNLSRFRRMLFNLVMNAVDAMSHRDAGVVSISDTLEGTHVVLRIRDNGVGMSPEKIQQLLADRDTLDGELHSLGFVFVRQTVREFAADLSIESEVDKGTTMTIRFPCRAWHTGGFPSALEWLHGPPGAAPPRTAERPLGRSLESERDRVGHAGEPRHRARTGFNRPHGPLRDGGDRTAQRWENVWPNHPPRLRDLRGAVPGCNLRDVSHRRGRGRILLACAVREVRGHGAREAVAHVLRGDAPRTAGAGRGKEADAHVEGPTELSGLLRVQECARRGVEFRNIRPDGP